MKEINWMPNLNTRRTLPPNHLNWDGNTHLQHNNNIIQGTLELWNTRWGELVSEWMREHSEGCGDLISQNSQEFLFNLRCGGVSEANQMDRLRVVPDVDLLVPPSIPLLSCQLLSGIGIIIIIIINHWFHWSNISTTTEFVFGSTSFLPLPFWFVFRLFFLSLVFSVCEYFVAKQGYISLESVREKWNGDGMDIVLV